MRITVEATHQAAIRLGRDSASWVVDLDITTLSEVQRAHLAERIDSYGKLPDAYLDILSGTGDLTEESIQADIDRRAAERAVTVAREARETAEATAKWLSEDRKSRLRYTYGRRPWGVSVPTHLDCTNPTVAAELEMCRNQCKARNDQNEAEIERDLAEKDAKRAAAGLARHAQLTDAVARLGDEVQRAKHAAGMMSEEEIVGLIRSEWLKPLITEGITAVDPADVGLCVRMNGLSNAQYAVYAQVRKALPDATLIPMQAECNEYNDETSHARILNVEQRVGELDLCVGVKIG